MSNSENESENQPRGWTRRDFGQGKEFARRFITYESMRAIILIAAGVIAAVSFISSNMIWLEFTRINFVQIIATVAFLMVGAGIVFQALTSKVFLSDSIDHEDEKSLDADKEERHHIEYLVYLAGSSRAVAKALFSRSGVYLIVGVFCAILGVFVFFLTRIFLRPNFDRDAFNQLEYGVYLVQNAGVLIICELVAFFFLRQSRAILDEFRYFDRIARKREETLALLLFVQKEGGLTIQSIVEGRHFFSDLSNLTSGETTEIIEARKLEKVEIDILGKVVDAVSALKK